MSRKGISRHYVPPVVISQYTGLVDIDGVVFKALAGISGVIVGGVIITDQKPEGTKKVLASLSVGNKDGTGKSEMVTTDRGTGEIETDIPVKNTSKITVTTDCIGAEGVWVAIAIRPAITDQFIQKVESDEPGVSIQARRKGPARRTKTA